MKIQNDPQVAALVGPELPDDVLPDTVVLAFEELRVRLIEPKPGLRVLVCGRPGAL